MRSKQPQRVAHGDFPHTEPPQTAFCCAQGHAQIGTLMRGQHCAAGQFNGRSAFGVHGLQNDTQLRHGPPPVVVQFHQYGKILVGVHGAGRQLQRYRHIPAQRADIPRQKADQQHRQCRQKDRKRRAADRCRGKQHGQQQRAAHLTCHGTVSPGGGAARCAEHRQGYSALYRRRCGPVRSGTDGGGPHRQKSR